MTTRRRWRPQDQLFAEVAAACGVPIKHIGQTIGRSSSMIMRHLVFSIAERDRTASRQRMRLLLSTDSHRINEQRNKRRRENLDSYRERERNYRDKNKETLRMRAKEFYTRNRARLLVEKANWRNENKEKVAASNKKTYIKNRAKRIKYAKAYYAANKESLREYNLRWKLANKAKIRDYAKRRIATRTPEQKQADYERGVQWRIKNRERLKEQRRKWYLENREQDLARSKEYRKANGEKLRHYSRVYYEQNKDDYFERARRRAYLRKSSRIRALHRLNRAAENARFALWRHRCAFCGVDAHHTRNTGYKRLTTEHVLPLVKGGLDEKDNIMPACATCNKSKGPRPVESWYRSQPFFSEARWRKIKRHCPAASIGQLSLAMPSEQA
jgi:hypothetical protein